MNMTLSANIYSKEVDYPFTPYLHTFSSSENTIFEDNSQTYTLYLVQSKVTGSWEYAFIPEPSGQTTIARTNTLIERTIPIYQSHRETYSSFKEVKKTKSSEKPNFPQTQAIFVIKEISDLSDDDIADFVGVSRSAIDNWKKNGSIRKKNLQKLLEVKEILERAFKVRENNGKVKEWLFTPRGKENITPATLLKENRLDLVRLYAESYKSPFLETTPDWAYEPAKDYLINSTIDRGEALPPHIIDDLIPLEEDED